MEKKTWARAKTDKMKSRGARRAAHTILHCSLDILCRDTRRTCYIEPIRLVMCQYASVYMYRIPVYARCRDNSNFLPISCIWARLSKNFHGVKQGEELAWSTDRESFFIENVARIRFWIRENKTFTDELRLNFFPTSNQRRSKHACVTSSRLIKPLSIRGKTDIRNYKRYRVSETHSGAFSVVQKKKKLIRISLFLDLISRVSYIHPRYNPHPA